MSSIRTISKSFLVLAALLVLLGIGTPGKAWAMSESDCTTMGQGFQSSFAQGGQDLMQATHAVRDLYGALDIKAMYCFNNIMNMFMTLGALSDPLNLIWNVISQQLMKYLNQLCSSLMGAVNQLKQFVSSEMASICIPIPNLGLGVSQLKLNLPLAPKCTGIPVFQPVSLSPSGARPTYDWRSLFPAQGGVSGGSNPNMP